MNQRFSQYQVIARDHENVGGDSNGNTDTGKISVAYEKYNIFVVHQQVIGS